MAKFDVTVEGVEYEVNAPDEKTAWAWANIEHRKNSQPAKEVTQPRVRGYGEQLARDFSITGRDVLEGVGAIPQILGGALEAVGVKGAGVNVGTQVADWLGLQKPESASERVLSSAKQAMVPAAGFIKGGQALARTPELTAKALGAERGALPLQYAQFSKETGLQVPSIAKDVGRVMASQPAAQLGLSGVSGAASESAEIGGLGAVGQFAAGIAAPFAVAPVASAAMATGRGVKNIVAPLVSESAKEKGAARLATKVLGQRADQAATSLGTAADDITAGQVAAAIDNADLAALQKLVNQRDATFTNLIKQGTDQKIKTAKAMLEERLAPVRNDALAIAEQGGVDPTPLFKKVIAIKNTRGEKTDPVVQKSMDEIETMLLKSTDETTGLADPIELNAVRGQIRNLIEKHSKESSKWNEKKTSSLERSIQLAIDDAIESGIAKADPSKKGLWSDQYMAQYREGAAKIRAIEQNLEKEVKIAGDGLSQVSKVVSDTENPLKGLNLLSRIATLSNFALRAAEGTAGKGIEKKLAQMMAPSELGGDKRRLAELMRKELEKEPSFIKGMFYSPSATRQELGYETNQGLFGVK